MLREKDKPVFPRADWERVAKPESIGYSSAKLEALRGWLKTQATTSMLVSVGGRILFEYGDLKYVSKVASVRKSILGMMYGKYVADGTIDLQKRVKALGLEDVPEVSSPRGVCHPRDASHVAHSRSAVHRKVSPIPTPRTTLPARGSQYPGAFFYYGGWDFNAAGTAFEKLTGKNIYDALQIDLADPIGMQDYDERKRRKKNSRLPYTVHPEYAMYLSTRDMARIGLLMLRGGEWNDKRLLPEHWSEFLTQLVTPAHEIFPVSLRNAVTVGPSRWYGRMWWVWDQPRLPGGVTTGDFYGAHTALGTAEASPSRFCPFMTWWSLTKSKLKAIDHGAMSLLEPSTILQMVIATRCNGACK